jgi:hypothetical protein
MAGEAKQKAGLLRRLLLFAMTIIPDLTELSDELVR